MDKHCFGQPKVLYSFYERYVHRPILSLIQNLDKTQCINSTFHFSAILSALSLADDSVKFSSDDEPMPSNIEKYE